MIDQETMDRLASLLHEGIGRKELAGGNMLVIQGGKELFYHEDGFADCETKKPIARNTIFRIFSMSKPVTSAAVMILLERGEIDLFEPVSKFLEGFKNQMFEDKDGLHPVKRDVTLHDLLSMTSGLVYGGEFGGDMKAGKKAEAVLQKISESQSGNSPISTVQAANMIGKCPLAFQPGDMWEYGTSADILGAVVEVVSGKHFGDFLREEIFEPLNMQDTGFFVSEEKRNRLAKGYESDGNGGLKLFNDSVLNKRYPALESGGGGLVSTIDDYARFTRMLINGGNLGSTRILRPKTVEYMTSATLSATQQHRYWYTLDGYSYGNLMRVLTDCGRAGIIGSLGEYGWSGWMGTYFCNCPKDDLTFIFMMQKTDSGTTHLARKLQNVLLCACSQ